MILYARAQGVRHIPGPAAAAPSGPLARAVLLEVDHHRDIAGLDRGDERRRLGVAVHVDAARPGCARPRRRPFRWRSPVPAGRAADPCRLRPVRARPGTGCRMTMSSGLTPLVEAARDPLMSFFQNDSAGRVTSAPPRAPGPVGTRARASMVLMISTASRPLRPQLIERDVPRRLVNDPAPGPSGSSRRRRAGGSLRRCRGQGSPRRVPARERRRGAGTRRRTMPRRGRTRGEKRDGSSTAPSARQAPRRRRRARWQQPGCDVARGSPSRLRDRASAVAACSAGPRPARGAGAPPA